MMLEIEMDKLEKEKMEKMEDINVRVGLLIQTPPDKR